MIGLMSAKPFELYTLLTLLDCPRLLMALTFAADFTRRLSFDLNLVYHCRRPTGCA